METLFDVTASGLEYLVEQTWAYSNSTAVLTTMTTLVSAAVGATYYYLQPSKLNLPGPTADQRAFFAQHISKFRFDKAVELMRKKYGNLYKIPLLNQNIVFVSEAAVSEVVFRDWKTFERNEGTVNAIQWMCEPGSALFGLNGDAWAAHRRAMVPAFSTRCAKHLIACSYNKCTALRTQLWTKPDWEVINIHRTFAQLTVDVICMTLFGHDYKTLENRDSEIMKAVPQLVVSVTNRAYTPKWMWRWKLTDQDAGEWAKSTFQDKLNECIEAKIDIRASGEYTEPVDMIDILLDQGQLSVDEMIGEMFGLVFAGHETTSNTLTILFMLVLKHPEVKRKVQEEADQVLGDRVPDSLLVGRLRYIEWVIKETLRMYPLFTGFGRTCVKPITIEGVYYPAGTHFWIDMIGHHQREDYFDRPSQFIPERWENSEEWLKPHTYVPFYDGAHRCVGERFAIANMRVIIASLFRYYDFEEELGQDLQVKYKGVAMIPNMKVRVRPRKRW